MKHARYLEGIAKQHARARRFGRHRDGQNASVANLRVVQREGKVARFECGRHRGWRRARVKRLVKRLDDTAPPPRALVGYVVGVVYVARVRRARGGGVTPPVVPLQTHHHV